MTPLVGILVGLLIILWGIIATAYFRIKTKAMREKITEELSEKYPDIKVDYPPYFKSKDNMNTRVYKVIAIQIVPNNIITDPNLTCVLTGKNIVGNSFVATTDKFVSATEEEYERNLKKELDY